MAVAMIVSYHAGIMRLKFIDTREAEYEDPERY